MTRRYHTFLWPGLLLVCCDKPDETGSRESDCAPAVRVSRGGHAPREPATDTVAVLRAMLGTANEIESPAAREKALADVAWNAIELDPGTAGEAFLRLPTGSAEKICLIRHYAMRLAEQDPDESLAWAATLGSAQEIAAANSQIALVLAETDPERAANLLSESGIVGHELDVAVVQVVQRWAAQAPSDAAAWAVLFPPGAARESGIKIIIAQWAQADTQAAFSWLAALPDSSVRKEAALGLEAALLQQPRDIRDAWLQHADADILRELEEQREQAIKEVGNNIPPPPTSKGNAETSL